MPISNSKQPNTHHNNRTNPPTRTTHPQCIVPHPNITKKCEKFCQIAATCDKVGNSQAEVETRVTPIWVWATLASLYPTGLDSQGCWDNVSEHLLFLWGIEAGYVWCVNWRLLCYKESVRAGEITLCRVQLLIKVLFLCLSVAVFAV